MTTFGSLPTQPEALGGDWHRDIGEGDQPAQKPWLICCTQVFSAKKQTCGYLTITLMLSSPSTTTATTITGQVAVAILRHRSTNSWIGAEFVLGSHKMGLDGLSQCKRATAAGKPGDIVFFNGKMLHRGCPNAIPKVRLNTTICADLSFYNSVIHHRTTLQFAKSIDLQLRTLPFVKSDALFRSVLLLNSGCVQPQNMIYVVYGAKWFAQNYEPTTEFWQSQKRPVGSKEVRQKAKL